MTTDGWTSRSAKSYTTVTAVTLSKSWQLQEYVLATEECLSSHTAENLAKDFESTLENWGLKAENVSVTTDNAANIVLAMQKCNTRCHIRCMAHTINLATQRGLEPAKRLLGRIRHVVQYFHRSPLASNILRKTQAQLEMPSLSLIMDVTTRWNSTYDMLSRYIQLKPAICASLANPQLRNASDKDTLSETDVSDMESLRNVSARNDMSFLVLFK